MLVVASAAKCTDPGQDCGRSKQTSSDPRPNRRRTVLSSSHRNNGPQQRLCRPEENPPSPARKIHRQFLAFRRDPAHRSRWIVVVPSRQSDAEAGSCTHPQPRQTDWFGFSISETGWGGTRNRSRVHASSLGRRSITFSISCATSSGLIDCRSPAMSYMTGRRSFGAAAEDWRSGSARDLYKSASSRGPVAQASRWLETSDS